MEILDHALRLLASSAMALLLLGCVAKVYLMFSVSARMQRLFPEFWSGLGKPSVLRVLWSPKSVQHRLWWEWASRRPIEAGDRLIAIRLMWLAQVQDLLFPLFLAALMFGLPLRWLR